MVLEGVAGLLSLMTGSSSLTRHGKFAAVSDKGNRIEKLLLPALPNNAEEYERLAAPPREIAPGFTISDGFVVHDVDISARGG